MYSIQFLDAPTIASSDEPLRDFISATVSVISTQNHSLLDKEVTLEASLLSDNDDATPCLVESYRWKPGMSSLQITLDYTNMNVIWPARLQVRSENQNESSLADILGSGMRNADKSPYVQTVRSDLIDPADKDQGSPKIERQFTLSSARIVKIWEGLDKEVAGEQVKPAGVVLLAYMDCVIASKADADVTVPELDDKLASAARKTLNVVSIGDNCGIVGIGMAQLVPDCRVMVVDVHQGSLKPTSQTIETNIREMFPAVLSSVKYETSDSDGLASFGRTARSRIDLILVTEFPKDEITMREMTELLEDLVPRSPKVLIIVCQEVKQGSERQFLKKATEDHRISHCATVRVPATNISKFSKRDETLRFDIDVYRGNALDRRASRQASVATATSSNMYR